MIHIRTDSHELNSQRRFACGIGPDLQEGDRWVYESEIGLHHMVDCRECKPKPVVLGRRASELDGNAANRLNNPEGWERWVEFSEANGHP